MLRKIALLDGDTARRAAIVRAFSVVGHVEPFEDEEELTQHFPRSATAILVHDDGRSVERLFGCLDTMGVAMPVVVYAEQLEPSRIVDVIHAGVVDCIGYPIDVARLAGRFDTVIQRTASVIDARAKRARALRRIGALSTREREVAREVAAGLSNKEIGRHLDISPRTVEIHRSNAMNKLETASSSAMVRLMVEAGYEGQCAVGWPGMADGANDRAQASATAPQSARASSRAATGAGSS